MLFCAAQCQAFRRIGLRVMSGLLILISLGCGSPEVLAAVPSSEMFTNLQQVVRALNSGPGVTGDVRLAVTVCAAGAADTGILVAKDDTAAVLLDPGPQTAAIIPGDRILIAQSNCLLRLRHSIVQITAAPVVNDDGIHTLSEAKGEIILTKGLHPLVVEWFNAYKEFGLEVSCTKPGFPFQPIAAKDLWHDTGDKSGLLPGLSVQCYEGTWDNLPDFNLLMPVRTDVATNFDLGFRSRDERVGLRFSGYFNAPCDGRYGFRVRSDDGAMLFLGETRADVRKLGSGAVPAPVKAFVGGPIRDSSEPTWMTVEGRVCFVTQSDRGMRFQLRSGYAALTARVADAAGLEPAALVNAWVRVAGVGHGVFNVEGQQVLGELSAASSQNVEILEAGKAVAKESLPLTTAEQVQGLSAEQAERKLPVKIRGIVTSAPARYVNGLTIQDGTRGIYVSLEEYSLLDCASRWRNFGKSRGTPGRAISRRW